MASLVLMWDLQFSTLLAIFIYDEKDVQELEYDEFSSRLCHQNKADCWSLKADGADHTVSLW